jgi:hypothetical protein
MEGKIRKERRKIRLCTFFLASRRQKHPVATTICPASAELCCVELHVYIRGTNYSAVCLGWVGLNACRKQPIVMQLKFLRFFPPRSDFVEWIFVLTFNAVPYLRQLKAGSSQRRHAINSSAIYVKFVVQVALGKVYVKMLRYQHCILLTRHS